MFALVMIFLQSCREPCEVPGYTEGTKLDTISREEVVSLQTNLDNWMIECGDKCPGLGEANNVWFSIESLTNYLSYAQHVSNGMNAAGDVVPTISGIRLYFGKNADNQLTVVASATYIGNPAVTDRENDPDLGFGVLNYGNAGMPPKKIYPH